MKEKTMINNIPELAAKVQNLEARLNAIEGKNTSYSHGTILDIAGILCQCEEETIQDAAQRVIDERNKANASYNTEWNINNRVALVLNAPSNGEAIVEAACRVVSERDELNTICRNLGGILGKRQDETLEDTARRVVAERNTAISERDTAIRTRDQWAAFALVNEEVGKILGIQENEEYISAAKRIITEHNTILKDRNEGIRLIHRFILTLYGSHSTITPSNACLPIFEWLSRHSLAECHGKNYTLKEPKP